MKTSVLVMTCCFLILSGCGEEPERQTPLNDSLDIGGLEYGCGGSDSPTFAPQDIPNQETPSNEILEAIDQLRETIDGSFLPDDGWIALAQDADKATVLAPYNDRYASATFENKNGVWEPVGWGECVPRLQVGVGDKSVLRWVFSKGAYPPSPRATTLDLLVSEVECSSGREIEGLIEAITTYDEGRIGVILTAPSLDGGEGVAYNCIGTAPTEYELELDEPVGDRAVVDLSVYPEVEPTPGTQLP